MLLCWPRIFTASSSPKYQTRSSSGEGATIMPFMPTTQVSRDPETQHDASLRLFGWLVNPIMAMHMEIY